jgi:hypothetical protein
MLKRRKYLVNRVQNRLSYTRKKTSIPVRYERKHFLRGTCLVIKVQVAEEHCLAVKSVLLHPLMSLLQCEDPEVLKGCLHVMYARESLVVVLI